MRRMAGIGDYIAAVTGLALTPLAWANLVQSREGGAMLSFSAEDQALYALFLVAVAAACVTGAIAGTYGMPWAPGVVVVSSLTGAGGLVLIGVLGGRSAESALAVLFTLAAALRLARRSRQG